MKRSAGWLAITVFAAACARPATTRENGGDAIHEHAESHALLPVEEGMSVYQIASDWQNQEGETVTLRTLAGRPQVVGLVYTSCAYACPLVIADMKAIEAKTDEAGFVLVSVDPERDTPGRLKEFATGSRMGDRWTLLSGDNDTLRELAAVLGVRYRPVSDTDFMHSNVIVVLDAAGNIVFRQEGYGDTRGTLGALDALRAHAGP